MVARHDICGVETPEPFRHDGSGLASIQRHSSAARRQNWTFQLLLRDDRWRIRLRVSVLGWGELLESRFGRVRDIEQPIWRPDRCSTLDHPQVETMRGSFSAHLDRYSIYKDYWWKDEGLI